VASDVQDRSTQDRGTHDLKGPDFHRLVVAAQSGDRDAIQALFVRLQPAVQRYCRARIGRSGSSYSSADDVTQEICLGVLGALKKFADDPSSFLPFVYGIASHKVADHYRKAGRDRTDPVADMPDLVDSTVGPEQSALRGDLRGKLGQLLELLAPRNREILVLRVIV
jgi:RNA polymerase sigma-70 factor (ECF subfamily)